MAGSDDRKGRKYGGLRFTNTPEIPKPVRKWLKISYALNFLMGSVFIIASYKNYRATDMFGAEPMVFMIFLAPAMPHVTYFYTKEHLQSNQDRFDQIIGLQYDIDFDEFLIMFVKMSLVISLGFLLAEVVGEKVWNQFWDQVVLLSQHVADTVAQEMMTIARKVF